MIDRTYTEALAAMEPPRVVILGPAPCQRCGAWVEWAGVDWLALDSDEVHDCAPYLAGQVLLVRESLGPSAEAAYHLFVAEEERLGKAGAALFVAVALVALAFVVELTWRYYGGPR